MSPAAALAAYLSVLGHVAEHDAGLREPVAPSSSIDRNRDRRRPSSRQHHTNRNQDRSNAK